MTNEIESAAMAFGVDVHLVRRAGLAAELRDRLERLEARAEALRAAYTLARDHLLELTRIRAWAERRFVERRQDSRPMTVDEVRGGEALLALLDAELMRGRPAIEATAARQQDAGRVRDALRNHVLGPTRAYAVVREPIGTSDVGFGREGAI